MEDAANERFTTRVPKDLLDRIGDSAAAEGISRSAFARKLMESALEGGVHEGSRLEDALAALVEAYARQLDAETGIISAKARLLDAQASLEDAKVDRARMDNILFQAESRRKLVGDRCAAAKVLVQADPLLVMANYALPETQNTETVETVEEAIEIEENTPPQESVPTEPETVLETTEATKTVEDVIETEEDTSSTEHAPVEHEATEHETVETEATETKTIEHETTEDAGSIETGFDDDNFVPADSTLDNADFVPDDSTLNEDDNVEGELPQENIDTDAKTADDSAENDVLSDNVGGQDETDDGPESGHDMSTSWTDPDTDEAIESYDYDQSPEEEEVPEDDFDDDMEEELMAHYAKSSE